MDKIIRTAMERSRASLTLLVMLWVGGILAFNSLPKESNPDITIPVIYVSVSHEGISPEDAERLLVRPLEQELRSLDGLKEMRSIGAEGYGSITLEFRAGFNPEIALADVRDKVDTAKTKLPAESDEPKVLEINFSQFPVINIGLSGPMSEVVLVRIARDLKREIEGIADVLEVEIGGDREDLLELVADQQVLERYGIDYAQLFSLVSSNNRLVAAGNLDTGAGRMAIKVPGVIEELDDLLTMPIKSVDGQVVTFGDVATVQRTFKDPTGFARIDGNPAVVLEVSKRAGANVIATIEQVKAVVEQRQMFWPPDLEVTYITDESEQIQDILWDLLNNVLFAVILVVIVIVGVMGPRPALLVGLTIPGAFLSGLLVIQTIGFTLNIVVLFSLILVAGLLVDGAIVVAELADRYLREGHSRREAFARAAARMSWPVIASTLTTIAVFIPLLVWPGIVGEFMKFLPATVIICLLASLFMALVFMPVMGMYIGRKTIKPEELDHEQQPGRFVAWYGAILAHLLKAPAKTLVMALALMILTYVAYARFNNGLEFFPEVEPESAQVLVHASGDRSVWEKDSLVRLVESRLLGMPEVQDIYARSFAQATGDMTEDVIGVLQFQFVDWHERRSADTILEEMRQRTADLPLKLEFRKQEGGPAAGKPIKLKVSGDNARLEDSVTELRARLQNLGGLVDISDNRPLPGIEWRIEVDREKAARYGLNVTMVGNVVQLVTTGLLIADYRPDDAEEEVDIRLRLPLEERSLETLGRLMVSTPQGAVPISNFTTLTPAPKTGTLHRVDGARTLTVEADVAPGVQVDERLRALKANLMENPIVGARIQFAGQDEDQLEAMQFLSGAFVVAVSLMALMLIIQFNSIYQAMLVLSAIVFSTAGILIGLMVTGRPFGVVMVGLGTIALAGIVVNNNIILIDTYNELKARGYAAYEAALETGKLRLRPVLLTAITTVLGLIPMVLGMNVDLLTPSIGVNAPSTQWWTELSSAIAGGLTFATFLTLLVTPCMLVLGERAFEKVRKWTRKEKPKASPAPERAEDEVAHDQLVSGLANDM